MIGTASCGGFGLVRMSSLSSHAWGRRRRQPSSALLRLRPVRLRPKHGDITVLGYAVSGIIGFVTSASKLRGTRGEQDRKQRSRRAGERRAFPGSSFISVKLWWTLQRVHQGKWRLAFARQGRFGDLEPGGTCSMTERASIPRNRPPRRPAQNSCLFATARCPALRRADRTGIAHDHLCRIRA